MRKRLFQLIKNQHDAFFLNTQHYWGLNTIFLLENMMKKNGGQERENGCLQSNVTKDENENKAPDLTRTTLTLVFVGFLDLNWAHCCFLSKNGENVHVTICNDMFLDQV